MSKPTVLLELGIGPGANGDPNTWFTLGTSTLGSGSDPLAPDWVYYDLDGWWESIDFDEGYSQEGNSIQPGTISAVLENRDRRFDKRNTAGPYYPKLTPPAVLLRLTINSTEMKTVRVDRLNPQYTIDEQAAPIEGADALSALATAPIRFQAHRQATADRINVILDLAGWHDPRDIAAGVYDMGTYSLDTKALDELNAIAQAEDTLLCMCPPGNTLTFYDRATLTDSASITFTDGTITSPSTNVVDFPYLAIHYSDGSATFANTVRVTRRKNDLKKPRDPEDTPIAKGYADWDSIQDLSNGVPVELPIDDCPVATDAMAQDVADQIGSRYAFPVDRIDSVTLDLADFSTAQQNVLIGTNVGAVVDVIHHPPPSGAANTQTSIVTGRSLTINNDRTQCLLTFRLRFMDGGI